MSIATETTTRPKTPPECYIAFLNTQRCLCCHRNTEWTELFASTTTTSTDALSWGRRPGKVLSRVTRLEWRVPLEQRLGRHEEVPFCFWCHDPQVDPNLGLLEPPRTTGVVVGLHKPAPPPATPTATKPKRAAATLDSLLDMME